MENEQIDAFTLTELEEASKLSSIRLKAVMVFFCTTCLILN